MEQHCCPSNVRHVTLESVNVRQVRSDEKSFILFWWLDFKWKLFSSIYFYRLAGRCLLLLLPPKKPPTVTSLFPVSLLLLLVQVGSQWFMWSCCCYDNCSILFFLLSCWSPSKRKHGFTRQVESRFPATIGQRNKHWKDSSSDGGIRWIIYGCIVKLASWSFSSKGTRSTAPVIRQPRQHSSIDRLARQTWRLCQSKHTKVHFIRGLPFRPFRHLDCCNDISLTLASSGARGQSILIHSAKLQRRRWWLDCYDY